MLVLKLEKWPQGSERHAQELGRLQISNVTDNDELREGDYAVEIGEFVQGLAFRCLHRGLVFKHTRAQPAWALVAKALRSVGFDGT